ncbi:MAG TPA: transposase [Xanthobacteraceae bacterium]|nr:transposase [Xanthobacteraceae bacterium]
MGIEKPIRRKRVHSEEFKADLVRACSEPGVSVAGVALANGVNANLVRKWMAARGIAVPSRRRSTAAKSAVVRRAEFVPVAITAAPSDIRVEVQRGEAVVKIEWPLAAAGECAAWLRQWLE